VLVMILAVLEVRRIGLAAALGRRSSGPAPAPPAAPARILDRT
jgi:hypothetical protein